MAIADRAVATSDTTATSLTYAHTVAGTTDLCIWVATDNWSPSGAAAADPTGVTYAAQALTELADFGGGTANDNLLTLWRRIAPATGANNVVITCSASTDITGISYSSSGVDQGTPNDVPVENDVTTATPTHDITSETGDMVVSFAGCWNTTTGFTAGGASTERLENNNTNTVNSIAISDADGAATTTMSWTMAGGSVEPHGQMSFNINAAGGAAPAVVRRIPRTMRGFGA